jgi:small GTP-binding protein
VIDRAMAQNDPLPDIGVFGETELQRDILASLPLASTELALSELLAQEDAWRQLEEMPIAERRAEAREMLEDESLWRLLHPPRVAIAGAPNVGKSTLANQLFMQERSITADIPGTTRDWVGELANIDGLAVMLVDTPGIRVTTDSIESLAIERSRAELAAADLVLLVLDGSVPLDPTQTELIQRFPHALQVINKCDCPPAWDHAMTNGIHLVARTGEGVDVLRTTIKNHFRIGQRRDKVKWWSSSRREKIMGLV